MAKDSIPLLSTYGDRPSPKAGTFPQFVEGLGRLVLQGIGPEPAYLVVASPVIGIGPSTRAPCYGLRIVAVVRNIWAMLFNRQQRGALAMPDTDGQDRTTTTTR